MKEFLRALWPTAVDGNLTIWLSPSGKSLHAPITQALESVDEAIDDLNEYNKTENIYFGLGLRVDGLPPESSGKKQEIVALPGFMLDFDFFHPDFPNAHKAGESELPSEQQAWELFDGMPDPSAIIHSAHGLQPIWLFERPWILSTASARTQAQLSYRSFQDQFTERAAKRGWQLDNCATTQRVWRLPGFINHKSGLRATLPHLDENVRYSVDQLSPKGSRAAPKSARVATSALHTPPIENPTAPQDVLDALGRLHPDKPNKRAIALVLAGQSFAPRGERDAAMQRVCSTIAWIPEAAPYDAQALAEILRPSLTVWASEEDATKTVEQELGKAIEKIERAQQDKADRDEDQRRQLSGLASALRMGTSSELPVSGNEDGEPVSIESQTAEFIAHHAIVQVRSSFWIYDFTKGRYIGPKIRDEILTCARDAWPLDIAPSVFRLDYLTEKGREAPKTLSMIMREYGVVADDVIGNLSLAESYYDTRSKKFIEAIAPMRVSEPAHNHQITHWLELLVGPQRIEKLLDWIAAVPQLDEQCCALYLDGVSGAGKGLLAAGLARLWTEGGPAPLINVLGNFNADMFRCPLILLDEGLPKTRGNASADIRTLIGSPAHTWSEKYVVNRTVIGAVRLLIAANNPDVLTFSEENVTANDGEAIVSRFLHIEARREAADWLREHNVGGEMTKAWVQDDLIAKHCLWLALNRTIVRGKRFLVEGETVDDMHRKIVMQGAAVGLICEWLARFATNPGEFNRVGDKRERSLALIGNSEILINTQAIIDSWGTYMKRDGREIPLPSTTKVGTALTKLSGGQSKKLGPRNERTNYHKIDFDMIVSWSNTNQIGNEDAMRNNFAAKKEQK